MRKRGYFGIGIENIKTSANLGTLFRSAHAFGADFIFTIGNRYGSQIGDTGKSWRNIPLFHFRDFQDFEEHTPKDCQLIGVELHKDARDLEKFIHPKRAIYLLGAEDWGLSEEAMNKCHAMVQIDSLTLCLNVATMGSIIMYDRRMKK